MSRLVRANKHHVPDRTTRSLVNVSLSRRFVLSRWKRCHCDWNRPLQKPCIYSVLPQVMQFLCLALCAMHNSATRWPPSPKDPPLLYSDCLLHVFIDCVNFLFPRSNTTLINSKVVTVIVKPTPNFLSTPVEIEFPHLHNVSPWQLPNLMEPCEKKKKNQPPSGCLLIAVHGA